METDQEKFDGQKLACMEIWGGSDAADASVSTPGLDVWVHSRPHEGAAGAGTFTMFRCAEAA